MDDPASWFGGPAFISWWHLPTYLPTLPNRKPSNRWFGNVSRGTRSGPDSRWTGGRYSTIRISRSRRREAITQGNDRVVLELERNTSFIVIHSSVYPVLYLFGTRLYPEHSPLHLRHRFLHWTLLPLSSIFIPTTIEHVLIQTDSEIIREHTRCLEITKYSVFSLGCIGFSFTTESELE